MSGCAWPNSAASTSPVNNVGGGDGGDGHTGGFLGFTEQQWSDAFDLYFLAAVRATRAALPHLTATRGAVVSISSNGARVPRAGPITYTTAKAALTAFSKAPAEEFGPQGVRVNTVSPGPVRTALWEPPTGTAPNAPSLSTWNTISCSPPFPARWACSRAG